MLEAAGLIELDPNAAFNPTVDDITSYKVNITIEELKANTIPSVLPDVAAAVVNGNYALDFGLKTDEAIYKDSVLDVEEYWNLIAARTADVEDPDTAAIYEKVVEAFPVQRDGGRVQQHLRRLLHRSGLGSGLDQSINTI